MTYTTEQIERHLAIRAACVGEDGADVQIVRQLLAERDAFRAVLEGAEYGNLDSIAKQDPDLNRMLGMEVKRLTIDHINRSNTCRNDALRETAEVCTTVIKNYDVMKPDGKTFEPLKVQKAAKGMVSLARQDIIALIEGATNDAV